MFLSISPTAWQVQQDSPGAGGLEAFMFTKINLIS
jgi:hypothetical protein